MTKAYYYEEIKMSYIDKVQKAIEERLENNSTWLTLKNGKELGISRFENGDVEIIDKFANILARFSNTGYNEYCSGYAMFNTAVFVIRASRK